VNAEEHYSQLVGGFGHGVTESVFSPIALVFVLIAGILVCILPRSKAIIPFFLAAILIPMNQILVVAGLHFPMLKILTLFGMMRVIWAKLTRNEKVFSGGMNGIDVAMIIFTGFTAIDGILLWREWGEVVFQFGQIYTPCGIYFLVRFLIRDDEDVKQTLRVWAWVMAILAAIMICEQLTGRNPVYSLLGGADAYTHELASVRGNGLRAEGTFAHAILAGTFGGISFPLFVGLWWKDKKQRISAAVGAVGSLIVVVAANTSTSYFACIAGIFALCCWPLRKYMRPIRWGLVATIVSLHIYMKAPVWALIGRINLTGDSSTWHRYELVNECIVHFWSWVLIGTKDYGSWGWDMFDLSNQYVAIADTSGIIPLISFLAILVCSFKYLGRVRRTVEEDRRNELFIWALCAAVFANAIGMFGISYFDQTMVALYALLAIVSSVYIPARNAALEHKRVATIRPRLILDPSMASTSMQRQRSK
jgi:hypothetical protein